MSAQVIDAPISQWDALDRQERIDLLVRNASPTGICALLEFLSDRYPDPGSQLEIARLLLEVDALSSVGSDSEIGTVAAYYYHIDGGGIESALRTLAESVGETCKSVVVTESDESAWTDGSREDGGQDIANTSVVSLSRFDGQNRFEKLKQALNEIRPDVLVYHAWFDKNLLWDVALCHACGVRVVLNVHGVFSHFLEVSDGQRFPWSDGRLFASVPSAARLCDAVVSQSKVNQQFFSRFNPRSYAVAHKLSDRFEQLASQSRERAVEAELLWVGRFDPYKHPEDAIDVLAHVRESVPNATLTYVGKSADGCYEQMIKSKAANLGVEHAITFAGFQHDVAQYYERASVLVLTTEVEGYCLVLAEALAAGLPVVAYDLPYLHFAECEGVRWEPQGDSRAMARSVVELLSDDRLWASMSASGQEFMRRDSEKGISTSWADVLDALTSKPSPESYEIIESERVMWDTLFAHYLQGEAKTFAQLESRVAAVDAAYREKDDLEQSYSFRVGRAILSPLRFVRGKLK